MRKTCTERRKIRKVVRKTCTERRKIRSSEKDMREGR